MERRILIVDDHDDLTSALKKAFREQGHAVTNCETRSDAVNLGNLSSFDLVISDLDSDGRACYANGENEIVPCLPNLSPNESAKAVKAFKICGLHYRREDFDEDELRQTIETALNYKIKFVDQDKKVREIHERIEFELPSAISVMHSVLEYLVERVSKMGVVNPDRSNLYIALDEAFVNAVKHGNKLNPDKLIYVCAEISPEEARFVIEDEGEGFNVKGIPDPLDPTNLFKTSGRGVFMIYNIMDEVKYNERGNRLTMVKKSESNKSQVS
jgi:serine/threonine-protein kinase RsbW